MSSRAGLSPAAPAPAPPPPPPLASAFSFLPFFSFLSVFGASDPLASSAPPVPSFWSFFAFLPSLAAAAAAGLGFWAAFFGDRGAGGPPAEAAALGTKATMGAVCWRGSGTRAGRSWCTRSASAPVRARAHRAECCAWSNHLVKFGSLSCGEPEVTSLCVAKSAARSAREKASPARKDRPTSAPSSCSAKAGGSAAPMYTKDITCETCALADGVVPRRKLAEAHLLQISRATDPGSTSRPLTAGSDAPFAYSGKRVVRRRARGILAILRIGGGERRSRYVYTLAASQR
mmetsp:Transcript_12033/g.17739  ORF Transcript_12033/g.17739 Transcript_12033/m.17739 type:complete len:288 (+) Transcript_12033:653-1516(+)